MLCWVHKKTRKASSGAITTTSFNIGAYQQFPTFQISDSNIAGIIDIFDTDGNQYYEVDYLAQDLVYDSVKNTNTNDPNNYQNSDDAPYILKTLARLNGYVDEKGNPQVNKFYNDYIFLLSMV